MLILRQNTAGIDKVIDRLQKGLFAHYEKIFESVDVDAYPRIYANNTKEGIVAEYYVGSGEYKTVQYFEGAIAYFFIDNDISNATDFKGYESEIRIVFFCDLSKLYNQTERMDEKLVEDTLNGLQQFSHFFEPTKIVKGINNVMKEFRKDNMKWDDMHPNFCFEINGKIEITY